VDFESIAHLTEKLSTKISQLVSSGKLLIKELY